MNNWSVGEIIEWQNKKFQKLIYHFYHNSEFYKNYLDKNNLKPEDFRKLDDLKKLPVINKDLMRQEFEKFVPHNLGSLKYKTAATGGSTGNPLKYYIDFHSWSYTTAVKIVSWQKTGYLYGDSYAVLGSSSLYPTKRKSIKHWLYFFLKGAVTLDGINLSDENLKKHAELIAERKIKYIYGYASAIYLLARYINENNIKLEINACFPTSEILTENFKEEILQAFGCRIVDGYGARDGGINAYEFKEGYYSVGYNSYAELFQPRKEIEGTLLVTDLLNLAFPFIRYEIGDEVEMDPRRENHQFNGQVLNKILGRISSIIQLDNGRVLTGPGFTILFKDLNVIAYRTSKLSGTKLLVEIQPSENYSKDEEKLILETYQKQAGEDCEIDLKYVNHFEVSPNGKRMFFLN